MKMMIKMKKGYNSPQRVVILELQIKRLLVNLKTCEKDLILRAINISLDEKLLTPLLKEMDKKPKQPTLSTFFFGYKL